MRYKILLSQADPLLVEVEADTVEEAQRKVEAHIYLGTLWEEASIKKVE